MTASRIFLGISVVVWLPYGLFCFAQPGYLGEVAGISFATPTGSTELRAMYGGLQSAIGCLALLAVLRPAFIRTGLIALAFLCAGLALGRLGGVLLDGDLSTYTSVGLAFEIGSVALAWTLLRRAPVSTTA